MRPEDDERDKQDAQSDEDLGFFQRWSRRKQAAVRGEPAESLVPEQQAEDNPESGAGPAVEAQQKSAENAADPKPADAQPEPPGDEDMPPLESIDQGGSVAAFFSPKVSEGLRRSALRRLWRQPEFSAEDLLDDYARDYTGREPLGDIVTAEMRYRAEQLRQRMERKLKEGLAESDQAVEPDQVDAERVAASADPAGSEPALDRADAEPEERTLAGSPDRSADQGPDASDPDSASESGRGRV